MNIASHYFFFFLSKNRSERDCSVMKSIFVIAHTCFAFSIAEEADWLLGIIDIYIFRYAWLLKHSIVKIIYTNFCSVRRWDQALYYIFNYQIGGSLVLGMANTYAHMQHYRYRSILTGVVNVWKCLFLKLTRADLESCRVPSGILNLHLKSLFFFFLCSFRKRYTL